MLNQLNVANQRAHTITHDRTFNGKPLYYFEDGLILEYLEGMESVLTKALEQYPRLIVAHLDLRFPSNFGGNHSEVFCRFFRSLASETNELCLKKNKHRSHQYHQTVIRYMWARESESTSHHHLILFFDKRFYLSIGKNRYGTSHYLSRVRKVWNRAVEADYGRRCSGGAYFSVNDEYELLRGDERFPLQLNELFYRLSYFTKSTTSCFGCSRH